MFYVEEDRIYLTRGDDAALNVALRDASGSSYSRQAGDQLVLTVRLARTSANSTGWTRLGVVASRQVQAKMGPGVLLSDTNYRLSKALYLLN